MPRQRHELRFEDVSSDEESSDGGRAAGARRRPRPGDESESDAESRETPQMKRVRLAKQYLGDLEASLGGGASGSESESDDAGAGGDRIAAHLKRRADKASGRAFSAVAADVAAAPAVALSAFFRGMRGPATAVAVAGDELSAFGASKDNGVYRWDLENGARTAIELPHHRRPAAERGAASDCEALALAVSPDGALLAAGGRDRTVRVWDLRSGERVAAFTGHQDAVTALAFRQGAAARQLFSGGADRLIKHWNAAEMSFVETLYGHQSPVTALDAGRKERLVSGGEDQSMRMWKIQEESQLVFQRRGGSVDAVSMLADDLFATGGSDGALCLWTPTKKRPTRVVEAAHGAGKWISALAQLRMTDLLASGSSDGVVRLWRTPDLECVREVAMPGFVNGLAFAPSGRFMLAALGTEPRLGRWEKKREAKNGVAYVGLPVTL